MPRLAAFVFLVFLAFPPCVSFPRGVRGEEPAPIGAADERTFPSLPGAVRTPPAWVVDDSPFDVKKFFEVVPEDDNAAPLYLEALFEFAPSDMDRCVSQTVKEDRGEIVVDRAGRTRAVLLQNPEDVEPATRAELVAEYADAFEMIRLAQKRKRCVFETGIGLASLLPHAQASRDVVRLLDWRIEAEVADGKLDEAIDDVALALRLSRDLRPRGGVICQLVSLGRERMVTSRMIPKVLSSRRLTLKQCERLQQVLAQHKEQGLDPMRTALKFEYVMNRDALHQLETNNGAQVLAELPRETADNVLNMEAEDFAAEIQNLNAYFRPWVEETAQPQLGKFVLQPAQREAKQQLKICKHLISAAEARIAEAGRQHRTRLAGTECLIALRRWQIRTKNTNPPDLSTLCKESGILVVPKDEYSEAGDPLRWSVIDGNVWIYSIRLDGIDNGAQADQQKDQPEGDWLFRLPPETP